MGLTAVLTAACLLAPAASATPVGRVWDQCGGKGWSGPSKCAPGSTCVRDSDYYSQCRPSGAKPAPSVPARSQPASGGSGVGRVWDQCGGNGWSGPTRCASGSTCVRDNDWYSQCRPAGAGGAPAPKRRQPARQATGTAGGQVNRGFSKTPKAKTYLRSGAAGVTMGKPPYDYAKGLGLAIRFLELQRSGAIESAPGGNNFPWRKDHLLRDGYEPPARKGKPTDLVGGHYEAGNRLKITLASGYALARLAFTCLYYRDIYEQTSFEGKQMMYWCKREVRWGADWLLKTRLSPNKGSASWNDKTDKLVLQVGDVQEKWGGGDPGDFDCFRRAENIGGTMEENPNCPQSTRRVFLASKYYPAADHAAEGAAALAMTAALFRDTDEGYARKCMTTAYAMYDFGDRYSTRGVVTKADQFPHKSYVLGFTYNTSSPEVNLFWASAALAWVHQCDNGWPCNSALSNTYQEKAWGWWGKKPVQDRIWNSEPVANWDNSALEGAFLMTLLTGSEGTRSAVREFVNLYVRADGTRGITSSPKGMRVYAENKWSSLRLSTVSSSIAMLYASLPNADAATKKQAACYARSQMGYIFGDTGRSYVVGIGKNYPKQVHHREVACTLAEDAMGLCDRTSPSKENYLWFADRPNPYDATGAIVGGPDDKDKFMDIRNEYTYTEVTIDFNAALAMALTGLLAQPKDVFSTDCRSSVPNYPW